MVPPPTMSASWKILLPYPSILDSGPHSMFYFTTSRKLSLLTYGSQNVKACIWSFLF